MSRLQDAGGAIAAISTAKGGRPVLVKQGALKKKAIGKRYVCVC
jgi:hypothetical protein